VNLLVPQKRDFLKGSMKDGRRLGSLKLFTDKIYCSIHENK
jgi:hypothetical protein